MLRFLNMALVAVPAVTAGLGVSLVFRPETAVAGALVLSLGLLGAGLGLVFLVRTWKFQADSQILGRVGHELRTPLAVMTAWADPGNQPDEGPPDPAVLDRQIRRMRVMVEGTLHGARRLGHTAPAPTPCLRRGGTGIPLAQVAADLGRLWPSPEDTFPDQPDGGISRARLRWSLEGLDDLRQVPGDDRLTHILSNLVQNAFRHGIPRARPLVRPWLVTVRMAGLPSGRLELSVEDEGPGVRRHPVTGAPRSLDPGTSRSPGTGLGFYLVRELTASAGGTLTIGPRTGKRPYPRGTRASVSLPVEEAGPWPPKS